MRALRPGLFLLPLLLATLAIYQPVKNYPFLMNFDDGIHIAQNPDLLSPQTTLGRFWEKPYLDLYIPVTYSLWTGLVRTTSDRGPNGTLLPSARAFHLANLALHSANTALVMLLLMTLGFPVVAAMAGAAFFALHPLQVEAVAWVSALKDLLSCFFSLSALLLYLKDKRTLAFAAFLLALLSKPSAVCVPLLIAFIEWGMRGRSVRSVVKSLSPWMAAVLPVVAITKQAQPDQHIGNVVGWASRGLVAADALAVSLAHLVLPFSLSVNYGRTPEAALSSGTIAFGLVGLALAARLIARRRAWLPAGLFVMAWLPTSGLIPFFYQRFSTVADRFLYLALIGPALGVAAFVGKDPRPKRLAAVALVFIALALLTSRQLRYWADPLSLVAHMTTVNSNAENHYALGCLLAEHGRSVDAESQYQQAIRYNPRFAWAYNNWGLILAERGQLSAAMEKYRAAIRFEPSLAPAYNNLGTAFAMQGNSEEAKVFFKKALEVSPGFEDAKRNLDLALGNGRAGH